MGSYPKTVELKDGTSIVVRPMNERDLDKSFEFFRRLSEEDRTFLRVDVTNREALERRMHPDGWDEESCFRLVAEKDGTIVADATLCRPKHGWTSHTAALRYIIDRDFRHKGLAGVLVRELFIAAVREGVEKVEVEIMEDNIGAIKSVEKIGFKREGTLRDFVTDIKGRKHNLAILSYFI
ncbi:MAG: GNAT family N-acetyltransferase [Acidobacteriota bacterium]